METGCLQVPDWTGQRCWLGSSSCCCCCWCYPHQSSWCCPLTSSFSGACWAAAVLAQLVEDGYIHGQSQQEEAGVPQALLCKTLLLQGPYSHSRLYHHLPHLPDQRTSEGAATFPSLLCFPQVAGIPQAWSTGCLQPCSSPLGRETSIRKKPNAWFITPSLMKQGEEQLWGWEKPALRAGPEQAVPETPRQHSSQCDTHRVERPSAATFGRGKS